MLARPSFARRKRSTCKPRWTVRGVPLGVRRLADTRCPICGTRVGSDDALAVVGSKPAHAECALIHWLNS